MAYSLNIPILAVPTLFSLAHAAFTCHREAAFALPMIDARRNEVYTALYDRSGKEIWPVSSAILESSFFDEHVPVKGQIVTCGDGSLKIGDLPLSGGNLLVDTEIMCSARHLVVPGWDLYQKGIVQDPLHYVPYYMKPPNITVPRQAGFQ
jgi:tRNA threonylcarbamoyladenosine biosynthesis protein TsaB